jgi:hypothetical protein
MSNGPISLNHNLESVRQILTEQRIPESCLEEALKKEGYQVFPETGLSNIGVDRLLQTVIDIYHSKMDLTPRKEYSLDSKKDKTDLEAKAKMILLKRESKITLAKKINYLLNRAFNPGIFKKVEGDRTYYSYGSSKNKDGSLDWIFVLGFLTELKIGEFTEKDGSGIKVFPEYAAQAMRYAELYKAKYGKDAIIKLFK